MHNQVVGGHFATSSLFMASSPSRDAFNVLILCLLLCNELHFAHFPPNLTHFQLCLPSLLRHLPKYHASKKDLT
jgi:hypothetical protein